MKELIIKKNKEDDGNNKHSNIKVNQEKKDLKSSATTTKNKAQNKRNFGYVEEKKRKFKLKNMKLTPIGNRIYLQPSPIKETTTSGIILTNMPKEQYSTGLVLAVGNKCLVVKIDDSVMYTTTSGTKVGDNLILSEDELLAII